VISGLVCVCAAAGLAQVVGASRPAGDAAALYRGQQEVFRQAMARVAPTVVTIETVGGTQPPAAAMPTSRPAARPAPGPRSMSPTGSPFIIADGPTTGLVYSSDGLILTSAFNFVRDPPVITVILSDGRRFVGELLARDEVRKLAMLKINATGLPTPRWVTDQAGLRVGQWALALGRGFGAVVADPKSERPGRDPSISVGIISGLNRASGLAIQTDARLSPANFGGPLIDTRGRVLGLCVPMGIGTGQMAGVEWYDSGVGFAIPHPQIRESADALAVGHSVRRGLLGIRVDLKVKDEVRVSGIADPSPARRAGMRVGDVIIAIDDQPVQAYPDLKRVMRARLAGEWVKVRVRRGDDQVELQLVLAVPEDLGRASGQQTAPDNEKPGDTDPAPKTPAEKTRPRHN